MEAAVVDVGSKLLKAGFAIPDQTPAMVSSHSSLSLYIYIRYIYIRNHVYLP